MIEHLEAEHQGNSYQTLLKTATIKAWIVGYQASPIPLMLLDLSFNVIWTNRSFQKEFAISTKRAFGINLALNQAPAVNLSEAKKQRLLQNILSKEKGYSWKGLIVKRGNNARDIRSTLMILPVFSSPDSLLSPVAYIAIVDNLNGLYRTIMHNTFLALLEASKLKDNDTGHHIERVNKYSNALTRKLFGKPGYEEVDKDFLAEIGFLAALHDVGKIGTPDHILDKTGPLNEMEREIMQEHTINGAFILSTYPSFMARQIALFHHEKWDGTGYPYSLSEFMIPLSARIVAIADVYDALRMKRVYKDAFPHQKTLQIMHKDRGTQFDPQLLDEFFVIEKEIEAIHTRLTDA